MDISYLWLFLEALWIDVQHEVLVIPGHTNLPFVFYQHKKTK